MNFDESVNYLYALGNEVLAMKLGLENIGKVLAAIGNPHNNFLKVQVAGTNGKGSTCAFLGAICCSANIKTGLYTSPHLISITERIKINGKEISEKDFAWHATYIREISENLVEKGELEVVPTYFEQVTAIAISAFAEAKIELAILETGLGGRFDATTATNAEIVAITPIDYDHQQILGNTLTEIASEKAAIIRATTKVIVGNQNSEAAKVIFERCAEFGVTPKLTEKVKVIEQRGDNTVSFQTEKNIYENLRISLLGKHQIENAKVALCLAETLQESGFEITKANIINGLQTAVHKGRLEFYKGILFDGAHNIAGAKALHAYIKEFVSQPITLIFGAMKDKQVAKIAEILFPLAENLILTQPKNIRSFTVEELTEIAGQYISKNKIFAAQNVADALDSAKQISATYPLSKGSLICVTGSLYLIGEAQNILNLES